MKRRDLLKTGGAAVALSSMGGLVSAQDATEDAVQSTAIEIPDMVIGDADAPIEMIEYASFTCPHCATWLRLLPDGIERTRNGTMSTRPRAS